MIDLGFLEKLLDLLNRSNADTIEIRRWGTTIRVSKGGNSGPLTYQVAWPAPQQSLPAVAPQAPAGGDAGPRGGTAVAAEGPPASAADQERSRWLEIKSPMVGTFYARPEPGADPYVKVGSRIRVGQTLCIIEAMKIMNPLDAEVAGVVKEICLEDGQPVEFGQVLFRVDPHG